MIKVTVYDTEYNYSEDYYYKNREMDKALALAEDYEGEEAILVAMDCHSKDYKGYLRKKAGERKMKDALRAVMTLEEKARFKFRKKQYKLLLKEKKKKAAQLEKISETVQTQQEEPFHHQFSEKFEREMEEIFYNYRKKKKRERLMRHTAVAAAVVVCITWALAMSSISNTKATTPGVNILTWVTNYFSFTKNETKTDILFTEEQIGFLPEGFVKSSEEIKNTYVVYEYGNADNESIILRMDRKKLLTQSDSENISMDIGINLAGYEYTHIFESNQKTHIFMWQSEDGLFYSLYGTIDKETMIKIMDGINYEK